MQPIVANVTSIIEVPVFLQKVPLIYCHQIISIDTVFANLSVSDVRAEQSSLGVEVAACNDLFSLSRYVISQPV